MATKTQTPLVPGNRVVVIDADHSLCGRCGEILRVILDAYDPTLACVELDLDHKANDYNGTWMFDNSQVA